MNDELITFPDRDVVAEISSHLVDQKGGARSTTIDNFLYVMENDASFENIRFNELTNTAELHGVINGKIVIEKWSDADEAKCRNYCEFVYGLYSREKFADALRILFGKRKYNPIIDIIDAIPWDGVERCEHFLTEWAKCEDDDYTREVSRLIFAGGINRLYHPGCKFDDVPILIGTKQGEGKSSLIRFLALNDAYYGECNIMEGQQAIEQLSGKWIVEISELLALTKHKEQEACKAYITRTVDQYRMPYDRNVAELPRRVIFIGTSNNANPLVDKTGNRRFYPVKVKCNGYELFDHEEEIRDYIAQCWAEARAKLGTPAMQPFAKRELSEVFITHQEDAMQDDYRKGMILDYLSTKSKGDYVCVVELRQKALGFGSEYASPSLQEAKDISLIMNKIGGWEQLSGVRDVPVYGKQRVWVKLEEELFKVEEDDDDWSIPFI